MAVWALVTRPECRLLPGVTSPFRVVLFGPEGAGALPRCSPLATASADRARRLGWQLLAAFGNCPVAHHRS